MNFYSPIQITDKWRKMFLTKLISMKYNTSTKQENCSRNNLISFNNAINHDNKNQPSIEAIKDINNDIYYLSKVRLLSIKIRELSNRGKAIDKEMPVLSLNQGVQTSFSKIEKKAQYVYSIPRRVRIKISKFPHYDPLSKMKLKKSTVAFKGIQTPNNNIQALSKYLNNKQCQSIRNLNVNYTTLIKVIRKMLLLIKLLVNSNDYFIIFCIIAKIYLSFN